MRGAEGQVGMETIFVEEWLHNVIRDEKRKNPEFARLPGNRPSEALTRADVEVYRLFKLRKTLSYVYENSSFYRELFNANGIKPADVVSLPDLAAIPFTDQTDLAGNPSRFLCVSHGDIARVTTFTTSGTTGPEKRVYCSDKDIEHMTEFMGAGMRTVAGKNDVVQIMLPSGSLSNHADLLAQGVRKIGAKPVKSGLNLSSQEQLELIKKHGTTVLFGITSPVYRMTQELKGSHALNRLGVKTIFLTGYIAGAQREYLRQVWNCDVHNHYGLTEMGLGVAVECHAHEGYHFNEADLILEVIDPETGRVLTEGEGELVFTTIRREGTPLVRYRTNDIARLITEPCPCGAATLQRFGTVRRRIEITVRLMSGQVIYPSLFDEVLHKLTDLVDYDLRVTSKNGRERFHFTVEVTAPGQGIRDRIRQLLLDEPGMRALFAAGAMDDPEIEEISPGGLSRIGRAKKKIIDERVF
jgi:phenylacetate-CoA ligase